MSAHLLTDNTVTLYIFNNGTAQYASKGMSIYMEGVPSHASEPENGINPAFAIAKIIDSIPSFIDSTANIKVMYYVPSSK